MRERAIIEDLRAKPRGYLRSNVTIFSSQDAHGELIDMVASQERAEVISDRSDALGPLYVHEPPAGGKVKSVHAALLSPAGGNSPRNHIVQLAPLRIRGVHQAQIRFIVIDVVEEVTQSRERGSHSTSRVKIGQVMRNGARSSAYAAVCGTAP